MNNLNKRGPMRALRSGGLRSTELDTMHKVH